MITKNTDKPVLWYWWCYTCNDYVGETELEDVGWGEHVVLNGQCPQCLDTFKETMRIVVQ